MIVAIRPRRPSEPTPILDAPTLPEGLAEPLAVRDRDEPGAPGPRARSGSAAAQRSADRD